ncbi:MAG: hypothetical protein ABIK83_03680 [Candidatus Zixiibacteriota bacterium]
MSQTAKQIVVVDNNTQYLDAISGALSNGYSVRLFNSSDSLLDFLANHDVNLLVLSAGLTDSYSLSVILDVNHRWPGLPVVVTTGDTDPYNQMLVHYTKLSQAVVRLPFSQAQFQSIIDNTLRECPYSTGTMSVNDSTHKHDN